MFEMQQVKRLSNGQWDRIYAALAPQLGEALAKIGRHVPCPVHGGKDGFRMRRDSVEGHGLCNTCTDGRRIDGFAMLQLVNGWTFTEAVTEVLSVVDPTGRMMAQDATRQARTPIRTASPPTPVRPVEEDKRKMRNLRDTWMASVPLSDPAAEPARRYFASRGLIVPQGLDDQMRFVPKLGYWEDGRVIAKYPALITRLINVAGQAVSLHRTYLAPDGSGKANLGCTADGEQRVARKMMGIPSSRSWIGATARLDPVHPTLAVAEGIETALAVKELTGFHTWAALSAPFMEAFEPPTGVDAVWIFADKDVNGRGQAAAYQLAGALRTKGLRVSVVVPPWDIQPGKTSLDWNDVWQVYGREALKMLEPFQKLARSIPVTGTVKYASAR